MTNPCKYWVQRVNRLVNTLPANIITRCTALYSMSIALSELYMHRMLLFEYAEHAFVIYSAHGFWRYWTNTAMSNSLPFHSINNIEPQIVCSCPCSDIESKLLIRQYSLSPAIACHSILIVLRWDKESISVPKSSSRCVQLNTRKKTILISSSHAPQQSDSYIWQTIKKVVKSSTFCKF